MYYSFDVETPAGATEAAAVEVLAEMAPGLITQVEIIIPQGVAGLAFTRALHGAHPLWPANPDASFSGDGAVIRWDEEWELMTAPLALRLFGWAPDARFPHTITWRFALREQALVERDREPTGLLARVAEFLGVR